MEFINTASPACFLVDNGSLQPAATLALRELAKAVGARVGRTIEPVSLLHSNRISSAQLGGVLAEIFETALRRRHAAGVQRFLVLPLFFGPSGALTDYVPQQVEKWREQLAGLEVMLAAPVAGQNPASPDPRLAAILADHVQQTIRTRRLERPDVILVDHGSPQRDVAIVRDRLAEQLRARLGPEVAAVAAASMERREGSEYAFNEPLLARALTEIASRESRFRDVVIAPLFFSPGRHAGPDGDIETIVRAAHAANSNLRAHFTRLVGEHPLLVEILADRYREAMDERMRKV